MFSWFRSDNRRKNIREDRRFLEARARRLVEGYLAADYQRKKQYYEVIAGAAAACQPGVSDSNVEDLIRARASAETALKVVKLREQHSDCNDHTDLITDAYATVAIAYRRAAAVYTVDQEMQQLGTAAVHLVTIANSYMGTQFAKTPPTVVRAIEDRVPWRGVTGGESPRSPARAGQVSWRSPEG